jgi:hypothetical protein
VQEAKKNDRKFWGGKKEDQGTFWVFFGDGGVLLVFGRAAWRVVDFFDAPGLAELLCNVLM